MILYPFYNQNLALFLLHTCEMTYKQYHNNGHIDIPYGLKLIDSFKANALGHKEWFGFILESSDAVIIAFRGTQSDPDWAADAEVAQVPFPYLPNSGLVHHGFQSIYSSCRDEIFDIYSEQNSRKHLYITGHSLGGALATLHAIDASLHGSFKDVTMYNYGSPRVGDLDFTHNFNQYVGNSIRFVNADDLIPRVPPKKLYNPFSHKTITYGHINHPITFSVQTGTIRGNHSPHAYQTGIEELDKRIFPFEF